MTAMTQEQVDLEDAARAAGYEIEFSSRDVAWINGDYHATVTTFPWESRAKDAHAFRLMVDAQITIDMNDDGIEASFEVESYAGWAEWADHNDDRHAATKEAIFQAAVAKGRAMREAQAEPSQAKCCGMPGHPGICGGSFIGGGKYCDSRIGNELCGYPRACHATGATNG
jgi:hypothetical protein